MVGGVFSQHLGTTGNPATEDAQDNAGNSDEDEDKENRLSFVEVQELTHPSNHLGEELTNLRKQRGNDRGSSLKSSSFHKIFMAPVTGGAGEPTKRKQQRK